ncbi:glutamate/tyrosine decarboxylase-like PLP-dependent enzyme [Nakamurella sp. UYEF19]|uniref:pyridoxal phosphate-dependent decarboxylase family protein n=1 Tax=Nakamurella sp. UYEF19 TaxID=1756392 RepID=UPI003390A40E
MSSPEPAPDDVLGRQVVDLISRHFATLAEGPVFQPVPPGLADRFRNAPPPRTGRSAERVMGEFVETVLPYPFGNGHPRFFGWVNSPPQPLGVYADALAAAMNPSVAGGNHAAVHVERQVVRWFCELAGLPDRAFGMLTSGGSMATLTALAGARHRAMDRVGIDVRAKGLQAVGTTFALYVGSEGHGCAHKAAQLLGLGSDHVCIIPSDADHRMKPDDLERQLDTDAAAGVVPIAVMATVGTVNTGAIDPIAAIADLCEERRIWLHVDGAYGGPAILLLERFRETLAALARADSIAMDPHKWMYTPVDAGLVIFRDGSAARDAFSLVPAYLRTDGDEGGVAGPAWFSEYGFEQTRPFRALKVWMLLQHLGLDGYRELITKDIDLAHELARQIRSTTDFRVLADGLSICCFRAEPEGVPPDGLDDLNRALLTRIQLGGRAFVSGTTVDGRFALRACIVNPGTTAEDINTLVAHLQEELRPLLAHQVPRLAH